MSIFKSFKDDEVIQEKNVLIHIIQSTTNYFILHCTLSTWRGPIKNILGIDARLLTAECEGIYPRCRWFVFIAVSCEKRQIRLLPRILPSEYSKSGSARRDTEFQLSSRNFDKIQIAFPRSKTQSRERKEAANFMASTFSFDNVLRVLGERDKLSENSLFMLLAQIKLVFLSGRSCEQNKWKTFSGQLPAWKSGAHSFFLINKKNRRAAGVKSTTADSIEDWSLGLLGTHQSRV